MEKIIKEWENCEKVKIFEIEVLDRRTARKDWLTFDIEISEGKLTAQHAALNASQESSTTIPHVTIDIDPDLSLDENLRALHDTCMEAITAADDGYYMMWDHDDVIFYTLPAYLAPYLINGDATGLTDAEKQEIDAFTQQENLGPCSCALWPDSFFSWGNDLNNTGAECLHFIFQSKN